VHEVVLPVFRLPTGLRTNDAMRDFETRACPVRSQDTSAWHCLGRWSCELFVGHCWVAHEVELRER
jgi:hypothetical protein